MSDFRNRVRIILVEPQDGANIGSVCRAMKTMGISKLRIVGFREYDTERIRSLSVHAYDIYEQSSRYPDLASALEGSVLSAGATRRRGKKRKYFSVYPEELAQKIRDISEGEVSVVFGREASGLTAEELALCNLSVNIPSSEEFPSLNLAQAVQVITYAINRSDYYGAGYTPVSTGKLDQVIEVLSESLERIEFFKFNEKPEVEQFFRDIFSRAGISRTEAFRIEKIFRKIADIKIHKNRGT